MNSRLLRKRIFDRYSENLIKVKKAYDLQIGYPTDNGQNIIEDVLYICPLCCDGFLEITLDQSTINPLTLEDLPPYSVGGKAKILTCKKCNNTSGSKLDKLILSSLESESFITLKSGSSIISNLKINNKYNLRAGTNINHGDKYQITFKVKESPYFKLCLEEMIKDWSNTKIKISFKLPDKTKTAIALLRIGYLLAFYYLGNRILFEGNIQKLRSAIVNQESSLLPHIGVFLLPDIQNVKEGIHILIEPEECRCFTIIYRIKIKTLTKVIAVPIPGPGVDGWTSYSNLAQYGKGIQFTFNNITSMDYIDKLNKVTAYDIIYKNKNYCA